MGKILDDLPAIRRKFHKYPETLWTEFWTTASICKYLEELGYDLTIGNEIIQEELREMVPEDKIIEEFYSKATEYGAEVKYLEKMKNGLTGVMGILDTGKEGPVFQFEADIDALPINESKRKIHLPVKEGWRSVNEEKMHACGHDVHITIGLGIAEYISENKDRLRGKFVLTFSPAEEGGHGARSFALLPIMKEIDYYFAYHDAVKPLGDMFYVPNIYFRAWETYDVTFSNPPSDGETRILNELKQRNGLSKKNFVEEYAKAVKKTPQNWDNSLTAACNAYLSIMTIPKRLDSHYNTSVSEFSSGTYPKFETKFKLTIRADNNDLNEYVSKKAVSIIESAAKMHDVNVKISRNLEWCYPAWNDNNLELMKLATESWKELGYGDTVINVPFGEMGTDDDVYIMNEIIKHGGKCLYSIIVSDTNKGKFGELHTKRMNINNEVMTAGVNLIIRMIEKLLNL